MKEVHLIVETNFILGMAKGQDPKAAELLAISLQRLSILIPAVCIMEAWVAYDAYFKQLNDFSQSINQQITQVRRNPGSQPAQTLLSSLEQSLQLQSKHNDEEDRNFRTALENVVRRAVLMSSRQAVEESLANERITAKRDNAILAEVLVYARKNPEVEVVFLSNNTKDFTVPARDAGLVYFSDTSAFLGWFYNFKQ